MQVSWDYDMWTFHFITWTIWYACKNCNCWARINTVKLQTSNWSSRDQ